MINKLNKIIEKIITDNGASVFLFGSKSQFNDICYDVVTGLREKYPHIMRIYVRAEYPYISEHYKNDLLPRYEDTYYSDKLLNAGKSVYIERNFEMIAKKLLLRILLR